MFQKITLFLFLLISSLSFSQETELNQYTWELDKVIVDGDEYLNTGGEYLLFFQIFPTFSFTTIYFNLELYEAETVFINNTNSFYFLNMGEGNYDKKINPQEKSSLLFNISSVYPEDFYWDYFQSDNNNNTFSYTINNLSSTSYQLIIEKKQRRQSLLQQQNTFYKRSYKK
ncbi:hypothetical protein [Mesonia sp.]|uniref:hypothetical protein n=1 Tax=Mesonia sp. TaxID=1960830 RepID=UPI003F9B8281